MQLVCDAKFRILNVVVMLPVSTQDSHILQERLLGHACKPKRELYGFLLGYSGYGLKLWLMTHILNSRTAATEAYNQRLS